jgi:hypothetical protein
MVCVATPLAFETVHPGTVTTPVATLDTDQAQHLMDELWTCGIRPTEGTGSAGSMAATERHLKDMRAIVGGLLKQHGVQLE